MKVILADSTGLEALSVRGEPVFWQNATRDCLSFHFDPDRYTLDQIDREFTAENCSTVTLKDEEGEYLYSGYVIRRGLEKSRDYGYTSSASGASGEPQPEHIIVRMAQISYLEQTQAELADAVDLLILSSLEV